MPLLLLLHVAVGCRCPVQMPPLGLRSIKIGVTIVAEEKPTTSKWNDAACCPKTSSQDKEHQKSIIVG